MKAKELMGRVVLVDRVFNRAYPGTDSENRYGKIWRACEAKGRPGWVVGERWLQNGATRYSHMGGPMNWERKGASVHCLLVAYWPTMKPVRVPLDGYRTAPEGVKPEAGVWTDEDRKFLRSEMRGWPRNKLGRWEKDDATRPVPRQDAPAGFFQIIGERKEGTR